MRWDDHRRTVGTRGGRKVALGLLVLGAIASLVWLEPDGTNALRERGPWVARTPQQQSGGAVGTTGEGTATGADNSSGPPAISPPPAVQDLRAALGDGDWQDRVGERVTITLALRGRVNDGAFWAGNDDERVLVVLARDRRDGAMRQRGEPSGLDAPVEGEQVTLSGTLRRLPNAEAMYSWRLTNHDAAELARQPIYLHVDSVTPASTAPAGT